jgi:prepilin-type N-terminal cleavage/methylation domain-containing protein/prepilin-type processing-associated H-X9-DG protein
MRKAFTLIELLVSIAILAILLAITFSIVGGVREKATQPVCSSNLAQIAKASILYADVNDGQLPTWDLDTGWVDKIVPPDEGALVCPLIGPLHEEPVPDPISDHGGYSQNGCLFGSTANVRESSLTVLFTESARFKSPHPQVVGVLQPLHLTGPDVYWIAAQPKGSGHYGNTPIGEFGALRHAGGALYVMVDGHVVWLKPTSLRLPEHGCGCSEYMPLLNQTWTWKGPEDGPYFSPEPNR